MSNAKKSAVASLLLVSESFAQKLIGLISTLVLARFLVPEDFGIIAIATLCIYLAEVLSNTGSQQYILRAEYVDDEIVNTSFTINLIFRAALSILVIAAAPFIVDYYNDSRLYNVIYVLAGLTILNCIRNPGLWLLKRSQQYSVMIKWSLLAKCASVAVAIIAAVTLQNYWALLLAQLTNSIIILITSYFIHDFRPKFGLNNAQEQWRFSLWVVPQSLLGYVRTQFDSFLVSSMFSQSALGSYHTMKYIAYIPCSHILEPATRPLLVELSKIKNNPSYFAIQFNVTFFIVMCCALPITAFLFIFSDIVVDVLLGSNWSQYSDLFGILCLVIPSYLIYHQSNRAAYVFGNTRLTAGYEAIAVICLLALLLVMSFETVEQFALAKLWLESIMSVLYLIYVSTIYNGFSSTVRLFLMQVPIALSCTAGIISAKSIPSFAIPILDLPLLGGAFLLAFLLCLSLLVVILKNTNQEWLYVNQLVNRLVVTAHTKLIK